MKRSVIGALTSMTILTLSCSGDDSSEQLLVESSRQPMTFTVSQEPLTRASRIDKVDELLSFYLLAQVETKASGGTQTDRYFTCQFTRNNQSGQLLPDVNEQPIWPGNSSQKVNFYAMSEYQSSFMEHYGGWGDVLQNDTVQVSQYSSNCDIDLMAAYISLSERESQGGVVPLLFHHMKAELEIHVKGSSSNREYTLDYVNITGPQERMYHFADNSCSDPVELDNYFMHNYYTGPTTTAKIIGSQTFDDLSDGAGSPPSIFVFPGKYVVEVSYWGGAIGFNPIQYTMKADIDIDTAGKKHIVNLELP